MNCRIKPFAFIRTQKMLSVVALVVASGLFTFAQEKQQIDPIKFFDEHQRWYNGFTEAWFQFYGIPEIEVRKSIEHWEQIGRGPKKPTNPGGGIYASGGDTHGSYVRWSAENGFVWLDVNKCEGGPMRILRGRVELVSEGVVFIPEVTLGSSNGHAAHGQNTPKSERISLVAVDWMGATYLVEKEHLADFADYSAGLGDYNGHYTLMFDNPYLAMNIDEGGASNFPYKPPAYPKGFERFHKTPIRGAIVSIRKARRQVDPNSDSYDQLITTVKIKLENTTNLKPTLKLHPVIEESWFTDDEFELKSFKGNIAVIEHRRSVPKKNCVISDSEDCKGPDSVRLRVGLVLSSNGL